VTNGSFGANLAKFMTAAHDDMAERFGSTALNIWGFLFRLPVPHSLQLTQEAAGKRRIVAARARTIKCALTQAIFAASHKHSEKLNIDAVENLSAVLGREF